MKPLDYTARAFECMGYLLYPLMLAAPFFFLPLPFVENFKVPAEYMTVITGWIFIAFVGIGEALSGRALFSGGAGSRSRSFIALFVAWCLLTSLLAFNPGSSIKFFVTVLSYLLIGQSVLGWIEQAPFRRRYVFGGLAALVGGQVLLALLQKFKFPFESWAEASSQPFSFGGQVPSWGYLFHDFWTSLAAGAKLALPVGTIGNTGYLAEFMVLTVPALIAWGLTAKRTEVKFAMAVPALVCLGLFFSASARAPMIGLAIAGVLAALLVYGSKTLHPKAWWGNQRVRYTVIAVTALVLVFGGVAGNGLIQKFGRFRTGMDSNTQERLVNYQAALGTWKSHPIVGVGLGGFQLTNLPELHREYPKGVPAAVAGERFLQTHNDPLQLLVETGLIGFLLALLALVFWVRETLANEFLAKPVRFGLVWGVLALVIASLSEFPLHVPMTGLAFVLVVALGLARDRPAAESSLADGWRLAYGAMATVLLVMIGWGIQVKVEGPTLASYNYDYLGQRLMDKMRWEAAVQVYALADRNGRFKGPLRWYELKALVLAKQYDKAAALFDGSGNEGLGMDSYYWRARELEMQGKYAEAQKFYQPARDFYPKGNEIRDRIELNISQEPKAASVTAPAATPKP